MFNEINTIAIFVLGVIFLLLQKQEYNSKTCTFSASNEINNINRRCVREQYRGKAAIQILAASLNTTRQSYQYHGYAVSIYYGLRLHVTEWGLCLPLITTITI